MYERNVPVDYKRTSLKMELPDTIAQRQIVENPLKPRQTKPISESQPADVGFTYQELMQKMQAIVKIMAMKDLKVKASDKNWYKHANVVVSELMTVHEIPANLINKYILFHFLDGLSLRDKLTIITEIYSKKSKSKNTGIDVVIQMYFDDLVLNMDGEVAIVLSSGEANHLYVKRNNVWSEAEYTDIELFKGERTKSLSVPLQRVNTTEIGFMHPFKGKCVVFKIKDMMQKRNNKGAKCEDASKPVIAEKIGIILEEPGIYKDTAIERPELCAMLEILMRWKTEKNGLVGGPVLFFGPEMTNEMDISNTHIRK